MKVTLSRQSFSVQISKDELLVLAYLLGLLVR
jgi:hypothetical protein